MKRPLVVAVFVLAANFCAYASSVNVDTDGNNAVDVKYGGTNATDAETARVNLGLQIGVNVQAYDPDLSTYAEITPSNGILYFMSASDATEARQRLGLEIGVNVQGYDDDLATAAMANSAGNSKYFGTSASGVVGFHDLPSAGGLAFDIDAPGTAGALLQSNGTKWARVTSLSNITIGGFTANRVIVSNASGELDVHTLPPDTIPSGATAGASVDSAGEIAIDTTSDQLVYYGSGKRVLTYKQQKDFVVKSPADSDDFLLFKAQSAITITGIKCIAQGGTSISLTIQECDQYGTNCSNVDSAITCDTDGAEDDGSLSNPTIDAGDWVKVVLGAPSGTVNFLTGSIYYVTTAD